MNSAIYIYNELPLYIAFQSTLTPSVLILCNHHNIAQSNEDPLSTFRMSNHGCQSCMLAKLSLEKPDVYRL